MAYGKEKNTLLVFILESKSYKLQTRSLTRTEGGERARGKLLSRQLSDSGFLLIDSEAQSSV